MWKPEKCSSLNGQVNVSFGVFLSQSRLLMNQSLVLSHFYILHNTCDYGYKPLESTTMVGP